MKKPLRLMAALLAFCIAAAAFPTVGLAADNEGYFDLEAAISNAQPGSTITLTGNVVVKAGHLLTPWIISKNVTIDGQGHSVSVWPTGILLGADVTFKNMDLHLSSAEGRNAIIANGHSLTLENVKAGTHSVNVFCGSLQKAEYENYYTVPSPGTAGTVNIRGTTNLQGKDLILGSGNIFAGSLSMGSFDGNIGSEGDGKPTTFSGDVTINIEGSDGPGSLGTIYAGGAQNRSPYGADKGKDMFPDPEKHKVEGTVTINGMNALPSVDGAGSTETNVVYKGNENEFKLAFADLSSLTVKSGKLVPMADSYLRNNGTLTLQSGAKLDLRETDGITLNVFDYQGNDGFVFLRDDQTWWIQNQVTGTTKVAIGGTTYDDTGSQKTPVAGHTYITAPHSQNGNFDLLPYGSSLLTLVRDDNGNWIASDGSSGESINRVMSFQIIPEQASITMAEDANIEMAAEFETSDLPFLDFIPLTISVNGGADLNAVEDQESGYYTYRYQNGVLEMTVMDNALCITPDRQYSADSYEIRVTIPPKYNGAGHTLTDSVTLTVTDDGTTPNPGPASIPVPTANAGLRWTGAEQTGVNEGTGYTLTGHKGTNAGNYTATATLEPNYQWTDGTDTPKTISWSIAKAAGPAAPNSLAGAAPSAAGRADGEITGTTAAMEYASNASFSDARDCGEGKTSGLAAGTYYVRVKETSTHEAGVYASITVPVPGAPTLQSISVNSTAHKTEYQVGGSLDVANLTIEAVYSDGSTQTVPVTANMVSGFDSSVAAESQTLTIRYENQTATYTVRITGSQQPGKPTRQVTVGNTGSGGTAAGVYTYEEGADVAIRAGSKDGFAFASWDAAGITLADHNAPDVRFKMPANDVALNAVWTPNGDTPPAVHTHVWDTAWKNDAACHWHDCAASGCTLADNSQKSGYAAHTAGSWVVDRPATTTQSGTRHRSCTVCGYEMVRESIPATGGGSSSGGGPSSGGGSSSSGGSSGSTTTVQNPDGSTTSTSTNKTTGAVTETTKRPDGSKTVVETQKDGTITTTDTAQDGSTVKTVARPNGTTETTIKQAGGLTATVQESPYGDTATIRIPSQTAEANPGGSVALPIPPLSGENASVTVHTGAAQPIPVEIPIDGNDATTVACLVNEDGSETILKTALLAGGRITVSVPDGATVHIRDNGKNFQDVQGHWAENAISFVAARELFSGEASGAFAPEESMSRAMLATVLARLDGVDAADGTAYQQGMAWAVAQGISDGQNPDGLVTREQFVVMLHRYAGNPAATNRELYFSDSEKIEAYAREAVLWATENGILNGYEDGSFAPNGSATRAQAAAMLARYVEFLNQR